MIDVLLATYRPNAEWLKDQIDSIKLQRGNFRINLICREDAGGYGALANFSALLSESKAEYIAFADQDDVWRPDKLDKSLSVLRELESVYGSETPLLVFCDGYVVNESLVPLPGSVISRQRIDVVRGLRFNRLLMQNFVPGNAMVFNAALRQKAGVIPEGAIMHDAWLVLVAAAFGKIGFVDEPLYSYRQHQCNALGATEVNVRHNVLRAKQGVAAFRARLAENANQARLFVARFGDGAPVTARAMAELPQRGWVMRRYLILRYRLFKQGFARNLALMLCA